MRGKGGGEGGARRLFRGLLRCGGGREVKVGGGLLKRGVDMGGWGGEGRCALATPSLRRATIYLRSR